MARQETRTPAPTDPADAVRAFYESHPYPAPIGNLDRHRDLYRNPDRRRALSLLLWPTEEPRANREILVAGCGTSQAAIHALREPDARVTAIDISETSLRYTRDLQRKYRPAKSRSASARDRAGRGARPDVRPDRLYGRAPSPARPGYRPSGTTQCPCAQWRDAPDGLCNVWACRHLHDAGILPPARGRRHGGGTAGPRHHDRCAVCRPSDCRRGATGEGFQKSGRARRCAASPTGSRLHRAAALCLAGALRPIVRALVRAGSLSPAMRGNREDATRRASRLAFAAIAARRGRAAARDDGQAQLHRLSRRSPRREPADRIRR